MKFEISAKIKTLSAITFLALFFMLQVVFSFAIAARRQLKQLDARGGFELENQTMVTVLKGWTMEVKEKKKRRERSEWFYV